MVEGPATVLFGIRRSLRGRGAEGAGPAACVQARFAIRISYIYWGERIRMMPKSQTAAEPDALAKRDDIKRIIGELDDAKLIDILALRPTILDIEEASMWLSGDADIFGAGTPLKRVAGDIVAIVTADEEEERPRSPQ